MNEIPREELERAAALVEGLRQQLAAVVDSLPYDADPGVDFTLPEQEA